MGLQEERTGHANLPDKKQNARRNTAHPISSGACSALGVEPDFETLHKSVGLLRNLSDFHQGARAMLVFRALHLLRDALYFDQLIIIHAGLHL